MSRITAEECHARREFYHVYLDGVPVNDVVAADAEAGYVEVDIGDRAITLRGDVRLERIPGDTAPIIVDPEEAADIAALINMARMGMLP